MKTSFEKPNWWRLSGRERAADSWSAMPDWLSRAVRKFENLALRERAILVASVAGLLLVCWDNVVMQSLYRRERNAKAQLDLVAPEGAESEAALSDIDQLVLKEGDLTNRYNGKQRELEGRAASLIDPSRMSRVLTDLIGARKGLRVVRVANLPVEEIKAPQPPPDSTLQVADTATETAATAAEGLVPAVAYLHGIEIVVEGDFREIYSYINAVESQPWRFMWRRAEVDASEYPRLRAKLVIATLSLEKFWLSL